MKFRQAAAALWLLATVSLAQAQDPQEKLKRDLADLSIEELLSIQVDEVYTASRYVQKIADAPASITVVTADDIRKHGYRTLADILRSIRGLYVTNDRAYSYVGARGFSLPGNVNNHILFMIDGHRLNEAVYGAAGIGGDFPLDVDLIERVEFVRGPGSSLYGSNAFFGVINVITRRKRSMTGPEVSGAAGGFATYQGRATFAKTFEGGIDLLLSVSGSTSTGQTYHFPEFDTPSTNNGFSRLADGEEVVSFLGRVAYEDFTFQTGYGYRSKEIPTAPFATVFPSQNTEVWGSRGFLDLKYEHQFDQNLDLLARVFFDQFWYRGNYEYLDASSNPYLNQDRTISYTWGGDVRITRPFFDDRLKVTAGGEVRWDFTQDQRNRDVGGPGLTYIDSHQDDLLLAGFAQADASILDNLRLNIGVRYDHFESFGSSVNPRAGLLFTPVEGTTAKLLYGTAFRAPSPYELYYNDGGITSKANPNLKAEHIATYELVVEQSLGKNLRLTGSAFHYVCRDLIAFQLDSGGILFFDNVSRVRATGGELEFQGSLDNGIEGRISYSYVDTQDRNTGQTLPNSPHNMAKLNVTVPIVASKTFASLELHYMGGRVSSSGTPISDYAVANLSFLARDLAPGLDLSASLYNLFNTRYFDSGGPQHVQSRIEQDGISFLVKLTYRF